MRYTEPEGLGVAGQTDEFAAQLRRLGAQARGTATLTDADTLLESLAARIDDGGIDVADAPQPAPLFATLGDGEASPHGSTAHDSTAQSEGTLRKAIAKITGIGMGGWAIIGLGSAAAATAGVWLTGDDHQEPVIEAVVAPSSAADSVPTPTTPVIVAPIDPDTPATDVAHEEAAPQVIVDHHSGADSSEASGRVGSNPDFGSGGGGSSGGSGGGLLPGNPVGETLDTVAPVINAIDVDGITGGLIGALLCHENAPLSVSVTDNTEVTDVSVRVSTIVGLEQSLSLTQSSGNTWSGVLAPIAVLDLGLLDELVSVSVEAEDAAGNTATASAHVPLLTGGC